MKKLTKQGVRDLDALPRVTTPRCAKCHRPVSQCAGHESLVFFDGGYFPALHDEDE